MTIEQAVSEHLDDMMGAAEGPADPLSDHYALEMARAEIVRLRKVIADAEQQGECNGWIWCP